MGFGVAPPSASAWEEIERYSNRGGWVELLKSTQRPVSWKVRRSVGFPTEYSDPAAARDVFCQNVRVLIRHGSLPSSNGKFVPEEITELTQSHSIDELNIPGWGRF